MDDNLTPSKLASRAGISMSYASMILAGTRPPSRSLAITIFQRTGRKFGPIAGLSDDDVATLARIEASATPTQPERAAA